MNPEHRAHSKHSDTRRNPFGVMDVPDPHDDDVTKFAVTADLKGSGDDVNAKEFRVGERHSRIDDDDVVSIAQRHGVHAKFAETTKRDNFEFLVGHGRSQN